MTSIKLNEYVVLCMCMDTLIWRQAVFCWLRSGVRIDSDQDQDPNQRSNRLDKGLN